MKIQSSRQRHRLPLEVMLTVTVALIPKALLCQAGQQLPSQDFEARTDLDAAHPFSKNVDFLLSAGLHFSGDRGHLTYRKFSTGFAFRLSKYLGIEPYYEYSLSDSTFGRFSHDNRLAMAATVGAPWKRWYISDRNLGEQHFQQTRRDWRYRNRLEQRRPITLERKQVSVFVWDEVYYSSAVREWYRNRVAVGAGQRLSRRVSVDIYYMHQHESYSWPSDLNGIEMTINTIF